MRLAFVHTSDITFLWILPDFEYGWFYITFFCYNSIFILHSIFCFTILMLFYIPFLGLHSIFCFTFLFVLHSIVCFTFHFLFHIPFLVYIPLFVLHSIVLHSIFCFTFHFLFYVSFFVLHSTFFTFHFCPLRIRFSIILVLLHFYGPSKLFWFFLVRRFHFLNYNSVLCCRTGKLCSFKKRQKAFLHECYRQPNVGRSVALNGNVNLR